ncbi:MAG: Gldg family protein [Myxococcota bacterium]|nr:Gldg family protein [Myxococcota bacterium]
MQNRLPPILTPAALVLLYIGERAFTETLRIAALALGGLMLVGAIALAALRVVRASGDARRAYLRIVVHYALAAVAVLLYFAQTKDVALVPTGNAQTIIQVLWPALLLLAIAPAIAMERAVAATERAGVVEMYRVAAGARAARIVVLAVIAFAGINFAANVWNRKVDLSYFKTTRPSEATLGLVKTLTVPVEVLLFYPQANDVLDQVRDYMDGITAASDRVSVRVVDQALDIELAKELKVRNNGFIFVRANGRNEQIKTEVELDNARNALKTLDVDFHNRLLKAVRPPRVAYFTTGHGERDYAVQSTDGRATMADFRTLLESQGFSVDRLSVAEGGAGTAVPENANLVVVAGPTRGFLPSEIDTLRAYLEGGGRMLVMIDPDDSAAAQPITDLLGVKIGGVPIANDKNLVRLQDRGESPYFWASNNIASHDSVPTLGKSLGRLPLVFITAAGVIKKPDAPPGLTVSPTLRSMSDAWEDANRNNKLDEGEKRQALDLAVAVEGHFGSAKTEEGKTPGVARAIVTGDSDLAATGIVTALEGNHTFLVESLRWLAGDDKQIVGLPESEKDVPIVHRKEKDTVWFYGTSFLVPAAVLGLGLTASRRSRRVTREVKE